MQTNVVQEILIKLGLTYSEVDVFFAGLKMGPSTIIQLSKATDQKRITTHAIVERLIEKGIFLETKSKRKRLVYPNEIKSLYTILDKKKQDLENLEEELRKASPLLKNIQARSQGFPNVRFYKGKEGVQLMFQEILSDKKDIYVMSDHRYFYDVVDNQFLEKSLEIRKKYKLNTKMLFPGGFEYFSFSQGVYEQKLSIKMLPESFPLIGALNIRGDKIGFHTEKSGFITTTIIEDQQISQIMKFLFDTIRDGAKSY